MKATWQDGLEHWSTPIMANIMWALLSALIVPIPLALVGLLGVVYRWADGSSPSVFQVFFSTMRQVWLKAYLVAAADIAIGGLVLLNLRLFEFMNTGDILVFASRSITVSVAFVLILINLYLWTLIAVIDAPLPRLLKLSAQLAFAQPLWTFGMAVGIGVVVVGTLFAPAVFFFAVSGAAGAYILSRGVRHVVTIYIPPGELPMLDV